MNNFLEICIVLTDSFLNREQLFLVTVCLFQRKVNLHF